MRCIALVLICTTLPAHAADNLLSDAEKREGWRLLFNGANLDGWMWSIHPRPPEPAWTVENGLLRTTPDRGTRLYLLTRDSFEDFEFAFEWKAEAGANSGIKYRFQGFWANNQLLQEPVDSGRIEPVALEYQIADDDRHPDALSDDKHSTAALYEYWTAAKSERARADVWHHGRIIAHGRHIEHWLDGKVAVRIDLDSPEVQESFSQSRRRRSSPLLAKHERRRSPLALQYHDGIVWFRNLKIRSLPREYPTTTR
jgi:hypothetical protein